MALTRGVGLSIKRSQNVVCRVVADEAIVVPIRRGAAEMDSIYTFNESGTMLWSMIEEQRSPADLAAHLQANYGLSEEQAMADTQQFIADLTDAGLIEQL